MNKLDANSVYKESEKPRRGLNTMGLFAILAAFFTAAFAGDGGGVWVLMLIGTCILIVWAIAEAVVHYLRFYSVIIAILLGILAVALNVNGGEFPQFNGQAIAYFNLIKL